MSGSDIDRVDRALEDLVYRAAESDERVRWSRRETTILADVLRERIRQEEIGGRKRAAGIDWRSCADPAMGGGDATRFLVLGEEVGEVANAALETTYGAASDQELRAELIQVAAVAIAWVEAIDSRRSDT